MLCYIKTNTPFVCTGVHAETSVITVIRHAIDASFLLLYSTVKIRTWHSLPCSDFDWQPATYRVSSMLTFGTGSFVEYSSTSGLLRMVTGICFCLLFAKLVSVPYSMDRDTRI